MKKATFSSALVVACFLPSFALACADPIVTIGEDGVARYLVNPEVRQSTLALVAPKIGNPPEERPILVVDVRVNQAAWISSDQLMDAHREFSAAGNGFLYIGPDECAPRHVPMEFPEGRDRAPIELPVGTPPVELFSGVEPLSGLWQARLGETRLEGCPAIVQQYFPQSPGALPAEWMAPRRLDFEAPFHPDQLELSRRLSAEGLSSIRWRNAGEDAWQTEVFSEIFGQIPAGFGDGSQMKWLLTIRSETEIEHFTTINIALPAEAAAVLGSAPDCRMTSLNSWVRVGD